MGIRAGHLVTLLLIATTMAPAASALTATDFAGSEANNCPSLPCTNAGELVHTLPSPPVKMWQTPDDNYLYVGENGYVNLYSLTSTGLQTVWELPVDLYGVISSAAYDADHELLALSNATGVAIVDVGPDREVMQFIETLAPVVDVAWDPNVGEAEDGIPYIWMAMDDNNRAVKYSLRFQLPTSFQTTAHAGDIGAVHVMSDGTIITGGDDEVFISSQSDTGIIDLDETLTPGFSDLFDILLVSPDESQLFIASESGKEVKAYDTSNWISSAVPAGGANPLNMGFVQLSSIRLTSDASLLLGTQDQLFFVSTPEMAFDSNDKLDYPSGVDALLETKYGGLLVVSGKKVHLLDFDQDGDGISDTKDAFPFDDTQTIDADGDGCGDNLAGNNPDHFPSDEFECVDSDGDGVGDNGDDFPNDPTEQTDTDDDGVGNNTDAFPEDSSQQVDSDGDGYGDNPLGQKPDDCPDVFGESRFDRYGCVDTDRDGYSNPIEGANNDNADAFPSDSSQWADTDGDGFGDNPDGSAGDACPFEYGESNKTLEYHQEAGMWMTPSLFGCKDLDRDGFADSTDQFDNNPYEWLDADNDGVGSNLDYDDSNPLFTTLTGKCALQLPSNKTVDCMDKGDTIKTEEELKAEQLQADIQDALVYGGIGFVALVVAILLVGQILKMLGAGRTKAKRVADESEGGEEVMADAEGSGFQYDTSLSEGSEWGDDDPSEDLQLDMSAVSDDAFDEPAKVDPMAADDAAAADSETQPEASETPPAAEQEPAVQVAPSDAPPVPESGLPEGWTMDQWRWYGAEWLDKNG